MLPSGPQWSYKTVPTLAPTKDDVILYFQDPIECLECVFSNPFYHEHIDLVPYHRYTSADKTNRVYDEWMSGDVAWKIQVSSLFYTLEVILIVLDWSSYWRNTSWYYLIL